MAGVDPRLIQIALENTPAVIALLKGFFHRANPDAPIPTDAEILAAEQAALEQSLAKDRAILARHPPTP